MPRCLTGAHAPSRTNLSNATRLFGTSLISIPINAPLGPQSLIRGHQPPPSLQSPPLLPLVFGSTTRSRSPVFCTPQIPAPSAPVFGPPSLTLADFGPRPSFAVALPNVQLPKHANDEYGTVASWALDSLMSRLPQSLPVPSAVAILAAYTQPGSAPLPLPISIPVLIVPQTRPSPRAPVHLGQSHLHASVFAASHPLSPSARVAQLRAETRLRATDQHHLRVALCGATQPLDTSLTAIHSAQPLVPLAATAHAVTVTCQEVPRSAHATLRRALTPSPAPPLQRNDTIYDTFRLRLPTPAPRSAICAAVDAIPRILSIYIRTPTRTASRGTNLCSPIQLRRADEPRTSRAVPRLRRIPCAEKSGNSVSDDPSNEPPLDSEVPLIRDIISDSQSRIGLLDVHFEALQAQIRNLETTLAQFVHRREETIELVRQHQSIVSPVRRMPAEVIYDILALTWEAYRDTANGPPWYLGHIYQFWRHSVLSYPNLWSSITIPSFKSSEGSHVLASIDAQLEGSADVPVDLYWPSEVDPR
ncbi:hypothetical protein DFH08DRAFT_974963 [Mycena albidolilacea]|uniref:F-box domain-containing protein n=1 Tax=Mycena albidolilacea TaxID=1033008 RepID=A0AAD6Z6D8_9AGAR|nr:hypothetical protein DFH08DRAFT_974963 [Mycena albidolilacea]